MSHPAQLKKILYVLDTNVLMHDAGALFNFEEHDLYLSDIVLQELDKGKSAKDGEAARNARKANHYIEDLQIGGGGSKNSFPIANHPLGNASSGMLRFAETAIVHTLVGMDATSKDNNIIAETLSLMKDEQILHTYSKVVLVTGDIAMRNIGRRCDIICQDYTSDHVVDDEALVDTGMRTCSWDDVLEQGIVNTGLYNKSSVYRPMTEHSILPNNMVSIGSDANDVYHTIAKEDEQGELMLVGMHDYTKSQVFGIRARTPMQNYALNLCMDTEVEIAMLLGKAGSGKTLLAIAAGFEQAYGKKLYKKLVYTRANIDAFEPMGFLPGDLDAKMLPWMAPFFDSLDVLVDIEENESHDRRLQGSTLQLMMNKVSFLALNYIRGRSISNSYIIIDEAQNLTPQQLKAIITRAGIGSKIVLLGNVGQIDTLHLTPYNCGIIYAVSNLRRENNTGYVILPRTERSRIAAQGDALP